MTWSFEVDAQEFIAAVKSVAPFASTDYTLPGICGMHVRLDNDEITLTTTDRYALAVRHVKPQSDTSQGTGEIVLPNDTVKVITSTKSPRWATFTVTVNDDCTYAIRYPDFATITYPQAGLQGDSFPKSALTMLDGFTPASSDSVPSAMTFNATMLAKLVKATSKNDAVKLTMGTNAAKPVKFEFGETAGLLCPMRMAS